MNSQLIADTTAHLNRVRNLYLPHSRWAEVTTELQALREAIDARQEAVCAAALERLTAALGRPALAPENELGPLPADTDPLDHEATERFAGPPQPVKDLVNQLIHQLTVISVSLDRPERERNEREPAAE